MARISYLAEPLRGLVATLLCAGEFVWQPCEHEEEEESVSPYKAQAILQFSQKAFAVAGWADKEAPRA